jgi:hypothetical protein
MAAGMDCGRHIAWITVTWFGGTNDGVAIGYENGTAIGANDGGAIGVDNGMLIGSDDGGAIVYEGRGVPRPYGGDDNNSVHMVRHDDMDVQRDSGEMFRNRPPTLVGNSAETVQTHATITHMAEREHAHILDA